MTYDDITRLIEATRVSRGLSMTALSEAAGYNRVAYKTLLRGNMPNARALIDYAAAVGIEIRAMPAATKEDAA